MFREIKIENFRIGNFVKFNDSVVMITEILKKKDSDNEYQVGVYDGEKDFICDFKDIIPIMLTEEWILKLGFKETAFFLKNSFSPRIEVVESYVIDNIWCFIKIPTSDNLAYHIFFGRRVSDCFDRNLWEFEGREGVSCYYGFVSDLQNVYCSLNGESLIYKDFVEKKNQPVNERCFAAIYRKANMFSYGIVSKEEAHEMFRLSHKEIIKRVIEITTENKSFRDN